VKSLTEKVVLSIGHRAQPKIKVLSQAKSNKTKTQQKPMQLAKQWVIYIVWFPEQTLLTNITFSSHYDSQV